MREMINCIVQGASGGIGLEYVRQLLRSSPKIQVFACSRDPIHNSDLTALKTAQENTNRLHLIPLNNHFDDSIDKAYENISLHVEGTGIELLVNTTGILHPSGKGETSLDKVTRDDLMHTLMTNTIGNLLVCKRFASLLQVPKVSQSSSSAHQERLLRSVDNSVAGAIVNLSARVGSIQDNSLGGWYGYRMSKAGLNMATKNMAIEFSRSGRKKIICVGLHPSTVKTDFSRSYWENKEKTMKNLLTPKESVAKMMNIIQNLQIQDSGKFYDYNKKEISF